MKENVILSICGKQMYADQEPETIELVTEGSLHSTGEGWSISYEESDLTGLSGVMTTFEIGPDKIILTRSGPLNSQMVFREGEFHESLYQTQFGALMITVCATHVSYNITDAGGYIDLVYSIEIENTTSGFISYHLDIQLKQQNG